MDFDSIEVLNENNILELFENSIENDNQIGQCICHTKYANVTGCTRFSGRPNGTTADQCFFECVQNSANDCIYLCGGSNCVKNNNWSTQDATPCQNGGGQWNSWNSTYGCIRS